MSAIITFQEQLRKINIYSENTHGSWVEFDYEIEGGQFKGRKVRLAIQVPSDFPRTPPSGIDFTPRLRPINTSAQHPHRSHPSRRPGWANNGEYWSRPHSTWNMEKHRNTQTYMAFVRQLWEET